MKDQYTERLDRILARIDDQILPKIERRADRIEFFLRNRQNWTVAFVLGLAAGLGVAVLAVGPHACWQWVQEVLAR